MTRQCQSSNMQQPCSTAPLSLEEALRTLKRDDPRKRVRRWVIQSAVWIGVPTGVRDLFIACKSAHLKRVSNGKKHRKRPRATTSSSSRPPSSPRAAAPRDRPILGAPRPIAPPIRSRSASNDSTVVAPPSTRTEITHLSSTGPNEEGRPDIGAPDQGPTEIDSDEPIVLEFRRRGAATNSPNGNRTTVITNTKVRESSSDSDVSVVWCKLPEPPKGPLGQGSGTNRADDQPIDPDDSRSGHERAATRVRAPICMQLGQSAGTCGVAHNSVTMPRKPATPLSVTEMYALVDTYAKHRTPALARALITTIKADCDRVRERERATLRRATEKAYLESLTAEQRQEVVQQRKAARKRPRSHRCSESRLTHSTNSECDYSDTDTGIHSISSRINTPEPPTPSSRASSRASNPPRKKSRRATSAPARRVSTPSEQSVQVNDRGDDDACVQSVAECDREPECAGAVVAHTYNHNERCMDRAPEQVRRAPLHDAQRALLNAPGDVACAPKDSNKALSSEAEQSVCVSGSQRQAVPQTESLHALIDELGINIVGEGCDELTAGQDMPTLGDDDDSLIYELVFKPTDVPHADTEDEVDWTDALEREYERIPSTPTSTRTRAGEAFHQQEYYLPAANEDEPTYHIL
ncbi:hypothetical protein QAD02_002526 [Eretmocerus hayati]|uniref:Uncharacterized protein n=1 Tax=Eretmocerus hayati TaxID=131215 RepID=A0ACC2NJM2_9HYME|nr:hypothetical protein QAD02_002526 [Eretmocerus hayati]